jgi:hypothetical protein
MLNAYKIVVETRDGKNIQLQVRWTKELLKTGKLVLGVDLITEITKMVFNEISKGLVESKINIDNIKQIKFEEI